MVEYPKAKQSMSTSVWITLYKNGRKLNNSSSVLMALSLSLLLDG